MSSPKAAADYSSLERIIITIPVLMASLLHSVNMSTAYVALPNIQGNLAATPDQVGWVVTAFVVASAVGTVVTGWLSTRFGRRRVFLVSIAGFTFTGALCAWASGIEELVIYRALQGLVSAPLLPLSQAIMLDTYPRERHGFAMSIWSMGMILGPVVGPTVGALLTELYGWRYVFSANVPLGIVAYLGIMLTLPEAGRRSHALDWVGVTSLIIGVSALQLMLDRGERLGWFESYEIVTEGLIAATAFYVFVVHCLTARNPYLNLGIFRDRNFAVGMCLIFVFGVAVFSSMFILPLFLQNVQEYPVLTAGWVMSARGLGTMLAMLMGGILADRFSAKYLILLGMAAIALSHLWMAQWSADVGMTEVVWLTAVSGYGMGMMWVTLTTVTFSTLAPQLRTEGAALFALVRAIGASMGTSLIVALLVRSAQVNYIELRDHASLFNKALNILPGWEPTSVSSLISLRNIILAQAEMISFLNAFVFLFVVPVLAMPLVFLLRTSRRA
ncbi:MAG: DHA2 family efflux MFS transporter permease subunit [Gammaproteobacteria bacterium]|nr:DHA2 family efflux MFS transporter permease subunit [Gammaproteobacteria bacterium]